MSHLLQGHWRHRGRCGHRAVVGLHPLVQGDEDVPYPSGTSETLGSLGHDRSQSFGLGTLGTSDHDVSQSVDPG